MFILTFTFISEDQIKWQKGMGNFANITHNHSLQKGMQNRFTGNDYAIESFVPKC